MRILIEGPNGAGKSSLADVMKDVIQHDAVALVHQDKIDQVGRYAEAYRRTDVIYVRGHISEYVYSKLYKRPTFEQGALRRLNLELDLIIYCRPPQILLENRLRKKQEQTEQQGRTLRETVLGLTQELLLFEECYEQALAQGVSCLFYDSSTYGNRDRLLEQVRSRLPEDDDRKYADAWTLEQRSFG
jgi:energy-coupling factor transporter ATP-binding protein EcfA2